MNGPINQAQEGTEHGYAGTIGRNCGRGQCHCRPGRARALRRRPEFRRQGDAPVRGKVDGLESVKKLVTLAKETGTGLVPVSSGGPHFHGDTVPSISDAIIVDLSGMKKVDLIDTFERVASMIEPGVTFGELIPAVAEHGLRLNMPLQPRATKSVVGSMLSREPVIMPHYHWDIADPIGSTEVVFGTGDMFRTGAAAGPGDIAEQRKGGGRAEGSRRAVGHRSIGCSRPRKAPWASSPGRRLDANSSPIASSPSSSPRTTSAKLLEAAHWLIRLRLGNELLILNDVDVAALMAEDDADLREACRQAAHWVLFFNLGAYKYFPDMRMEGQHPGCPGTHAAAQPGDARRTSAASGPASSWRPSAGRPRSPTGSCAGAAAARTSSSSPPTRRSPGR